MCGIVGMVAKKRLSGFTYEHREVFEQMLFVDTLRGPDSTGMYQVNKWGNASWCKEASTAEYFLSDKDVRSKLTDISFDGVAVVGHNRLTPRAGAFWPLRRKRPCCAAKGRRSGLR